MRFLKMVDKIHNNIVRQGTSVEAWTSMVEERWFSVFYFNVYNSYLDLMK